MRLTDIDRQIALNAISQLPSRFRTTDVSQHPLVREHHEHLRNERNYNAVFGSFLSRLAQGSKPPIKYLSPGSGDAWWTRLEVSTSSDVLAENIDVKASSESSRMVSVMTKVERKTYDKLRLIAFVRGQSFARLVRLALENLVAEASIPDDLMQQIHAVGEKMGADTEVVDEEQDDGE